MKILCIVCSHSLNILVFPHYLLWATLPWDQHFIVFTANKPATAPQTFRSYVSTDACEDKSSSSCRLSWRLFLCTWVATVCFPLSHLQHSWPSLPFDTTGVLMLRLMQTHFYAMTCRKLNFIYPLAKTKKSSKALWLAWATRDSCPALPG